MNELKKVLASENITIENLEEEVRALGFDPANLSDESTLAVALKLKEKFANKLGKNRKKAITPDNAPVEIATVKAVKAVDELVAKYQAMAEMVADKKSAKIISIIEDIPNLTMSRVRQLLEDSEGNLDFFLNSSEDVENSFLAKFDA